MNPGEIIFAEKIGERTARPAENHHVNSRDSEGEFLRQGVFVVSRIGVFGSSVYSIN
jgi:hypothetical protein